MIDITVDNNEVSVDMRKYHSFNERDALSALLTDVIEMTKFSGETITLWQVYYDSTERKTMKKLIREWH